MRYRKLQKGMKLWQNIKCWFLRSDIKVVDILQIGGVTS